MIDSPKEWLLLSVLILFLITAISCIFFARFTMARIERKIEKEGFINTFDWDGVGARIVFYAYAIVLPERFAHRLEKRLINSSLVRDYASPIDRIGGLVFLISSNLLILVCIIGWLMWG